MKPELEDFIFLTLVRFVVGFVIFLLTLLMFRLLL